VYDLDVYDRNLDIQLNRWLRRAELALHQNNLVKARSYFYRVLGVDPENAAAESGLAQVNARLKNVEMQENRKKYEKEIIALWTEGMNYYNNGQFIFAKEKFNQILEIDPENAGALKYLSIIQGQVSKVTDLQADKMFTQGMEYYNMADYDRAAKYFNAVYAADPKRTDAREYYELSRKALNMSITEMSSRNTTAKAQARSRLADKDDSLLSSNQKIQKEMEMYFNQSVDLFNKGRYDDALKSFVALREKAIKDNYYDLNQQIREYTAKSRSAICEGYFKEALAFIKIEKNEEAIEKLKKALEYNKDYTPAVREYEKLTASLSQRYYEMGIKSYSAGQKARATDYLEKSLEYDPKKIESKKALDRIKALGD
jgi:tetratricopeptide (TPR) repeat protein